MAKIMVTPTDGDPYEVDGAFKVHETGVLQYTPDGGHRTYLSPVAWKKVEVTVPGRTKVPADG